MISNSIQSQIAAALKTHDEIRLSTLRMLSSALSYEKIEKQHDLSEEEEAVVVRREAKKHRDSIEAYQKAAREDLVQKEKAELEILKEFLPPEISDEELEKVVSETISRLNASSVSDMGKVIGAVLEKLKGQADGSRVSALVKAKLS
jgi:uncharacterized protein YqeY